ncbi:MAG: response regulator [Dehalogenimonas sp.]
MSITIQLCDDHHLVRAALRCMLESEPMFKIVGESGTGNESLILARKLRPNVLITDLILPDISGIELGQEVIKQRLGTAVIILTMHNNENYVQSALRSGVLGYVLKDALSTDLFEAINEVTQGRHYLSKSLSELAFNGYMREASRKAQDDPYERLSSRERQTLFLTAQGLSRTEIAKRLFISVRTVDSHRANVMQKLGFANQSELLRYAIERGTSPAIATSLDNKNPQTISNNKPQ